jgi:hypothetical protein
VWICVRMMTSNQYGLGNVIQVGETGSWTQCLIVFEASVATSTCG